MTTKREHFEKRLSQLEKERSTWEPQWWDIAEQMIPYRVIKDKYKRNKGDKEELKIINNTPTRSLATLAAGMMAGITSPARKWFGLTVADKTLSEKGAVREYLDQVQRIIQDKLATSNWYNSLANAVYPDIGAIGTSAMFIDEPEPGEIWFNSIAIGRYYLDTNEQGTVDTFFRKVELNTRQMVQRFGIKNVSEQVNSAWRDGRFDQVWSVVHAVKPNDEYEKDMLGSFPYVSVWWDRTDTQNDFLSERGYHEFPVLAPRWFVRPGDVYGRGPGWEIRGDCRMLQHQERRYIRMVDKIVDPPMRSAGNVKRGSLLPGDVTHMGMGDRAMFEPAMSISPQAMAEIKEHIMRYEDRIRQGMYTNLWLALTTDDRAQRATATEVEARRQEVMLMLGPLLENLNNDLLEPCIERVFSILDRRDMLPAPPEELQGSEVKIEFISIMHTMQQATGLIGIQTLVNEVAMLAQLDQSALDKLNSDVIVDEIARISGVRPDSVLSNEDVEEIRAQRQQQEQAAVEGQAMLDATQGMKNLGDTDPSNLQEVVQGISPVAASQGGALGDIGDGT